MKVFNSAKELTKEINHLKNSGKSIGFVPTMGALHDGHASLIKRARGECDICVCSVFVNPKQFNEKKDFEVYPRQIKEDLLILGQQHCDIVFTPSVLEVFPKPEKINFDFGSITDLFEGKYRPGHFNGVASVVQRLLAITNPHKAYFGKKDYQQLLVIKAMVKQLKIPVDIIGCEIIRGKSGLALSSRNKLLSLSALEKAAKLSSILFKINALRNQLSLQDLIDLGRYDITSDPELNYEYFDIVNPITLAPLNKDFTRAIALLAARTEGVRLIDNYTIERN